MTTTTDRMMDQINVITAGPRAGKSSTLRELGARGYRTLPEGARIVFDQKISEGLDSEETRELDNFRELLKEKNRQVESHIPEDEVVFLDRSIIDNLAFMELNNELISREFIMECKQKEYDNVFLLDRLPMKQDDVRDESEEEAKRVHELLRAWYEKFGFNVVDVPLMTVEERADLIEKQITHVPIH